MNDDSAAPHIVKPAAARKSASPTVVAAVAAWALAIAVAGGLGIGWLLAWRVYGNLAFLVLGYVAGFGARRINGRAEPWVGWAMVAAMLASLYIAEAGWLYFASIRGAETFLGALVMVPRLPWIATGPLLIGVVCAAVGAHGAYQIAGSPWRYVMVRDQ